MDTLLSQYLTQIKQHVTEIDLETLHSKIQQQDTCIVLDVRDKDSWNKSHLPNAIHCERGMLELKIEKICPDFTREIIIYCGGGTRSCLCAETLQRMGYANVKSLSQGYRGWEQQKLPLEKSNSENIT